jgi:hypothetical protein
VHLSVPGIGQEVVVYWSCRNKEHEEIFVLKSSRRGERTKIMIHEFLEGLYANSRIYVYD